MGLERYIIKLINFHLLSFQNLLKKNCQLIQKIIFKHGNRKIQTKVKSFERKLKVPKNKR